MKALVFHGPGSRQWEEVPDPTLEAPTDIITRVDASTICGSDLHILKGDVLAAPLEAFVAEASRHPRFRLAAAAL